MSHATDTARNLAHVMQMMVEEAIEAKDDPGFVFGDAESLRDLADVLPDDPSNSLITESYRDGGYLTNDAGFVITLPDNSQLCITITAQ